MLDLKIMNGTVVDGTGGARFRADVGVQNGRVVTLGEITEPAIATIDASGLIVAPGFIDAHTHYDAQVFWDPSLSPSCFHGVTTAIGGFCGFSIAPITPEAASYIKPMLARVEGMPLEVLDSAVPWNWSSFGEFLSRLDGKVGLNVGFFCGHSALRRIAMGSRAVGHRATAAEVVHMESLLAASLAEGALGFSTTVSPTHSDADGNPVPSRWADYAEILALGRVVRDHEGTGLELLPDTDFAPEVVELLADFSLAGNRPVNWNVLAVMGNDPVAAAERAEKMLRVSDVARARGGEVIALTIPAAMNLYVNLQNGVGFDSMPGRWQAIFQLPPAERIEKFRDPQVRRQLLHDAALIPPDSTLAFKTDFGNYFVVSTKSPENASLEGRLVGDIAQERGCAPLDAMLDIAIADGLATTFAPDLGGEDAASYALRGKLWEDDRALIGGSDAGAHIDMIDTFAFSSALLQRGVRDHRVISLERAVQLITDRIAQYFGLIDRGRLKPGYLADIVVFDKATVGRGSTYMRHDLPGGGPRIYADATGIAHVIVNGVQIVADGEHTGAMPGKVLRSGADTRTVAMDALRAN